MKKDLKVKHIMTMELVVGNVSNQFSQVLDFFCQFKIAHLPIVDENNKLLGIISVNDALNYMHEKLGAGQSLNLESLNADFKMDELMTPEPYFISAEATVEEALERLDKGINN